MSHLTIVANIIAKEDQIELVKKELLKLIEPTKKEEGCIQYDLHQDNEDSSCFMFFEKWQSRDLWQTHMKAQHLSDYLKATEGAIEEFVINEMTHVN